MKLPRERWAGMLLAGAVAWALGLPARGCTTFLLTAQDRTAIVGRSMDFDAPLPWTLAAVPRGTTFTGTGPEGKPGHAFAAKHAFVGIAAGPQPMVIDGLNDAGLSAAGLWLSGYTRYPSPETVTPGTGLAPWEVVAYLLATAADVPEARRALESVVVWPAPLPDIGLLSLHYVVHDRTGACLVIEFVDGKIRLTDNPTTAATNAPPIEWHLVNLSNYVNLRTTEVPPFAIDGLQTVSTGPGAALRGLPGDFSSPSRFVRIAFLKSLVTSVPDAAAAVNLALHLLNSVDVPAGVELTTPRESAAAPPVRTQWATVKDLTHGVLAYRTYEDLTLRSVTLGRIAFRGTQPLFAPLSRTPSVPDETSAFAPTTP